MPQNEWQSIETAPKDGSEILLGTPDDVFAGFYHDGSQNYWHFAGWYAEMARGNLLTTKPCRVTHWMPLPEVPDG